MRFANDAQTRLHFVDGLRGLAVSSVVGFHVHIPHMGGGFTGVDMFFVISGFVITIQLIRNLEAGTFSFWTFYYQRFLRIIPPLVLVCLCTVLLAPYFPFLPKELARLDYTAVSALTMVVNYYLAGKNGYFETSSQNNPLLHTWSLGVEEQYYAFAPAILLLVFYLCKRRGFGFPRALLILSFATITVSLCLAALWPSERFAFYAVWTRAWQFGAGGLAAIVAMRPPKTSAAFQSIVQAAALVLLCGAIAISRGDNPFPSATVIVVTAMTATALISGTNATGPIAALLASRPLRAIGLVSYAWYLWHWPFITFARSTNLMHDDLLRDGTAAMLALLASVPTYYLVEAPLRRLRRQMPRWLRPKPVLLAGTAALLLIGVAIVPAADRADANLMAMPPSPGFLACRPFKLSMPTRETAPCLIGDAEKPSVLVWGDSAAWAFLHIAERFTRSSGRSALVVATPACLPQATGHPVQSAHCNEANREVAAILDDPALHFDSLILAARWALYSGEPTAARGDFAPRLRFDVPFDVALRNELGRIIEHAHAAQAGRILLIGPWPDFEQPVTDCLWRADRTGHDRAECAMSREDFLARNGAIVAALQDTAGSYANVRAIDATDLMCGSVLCLPFEGDTLLYSDDFHLTIAGAEKFSRGFAEDLAWVFGDAKRASSGETAPAN